MSDRSAPHRRRGPALTGGGLRIGVLASIAHRCPPLGYGPWEQVASTIAEGLVARGHDVTLFATADSTTAGRLHAEAPHGYEEGLAYDVKVWEHLHVASAFERAHELDVLANHMDFPPLVFSRLTRTPVVTTIHGFGSEAVLPVYRAYDQSCGGPATYVSISDADRHPDLTYARTIHHGIDTSAFTYRPDPGSYLLFLGRIHPDKGTHQAVQLARRTGLPLVVAGIVHDRDYYDREVRPYEGAQISYVGPVGPVERDVLLGGALALVHLIGFDEPFGLAVVESLATGTPVLTYPRGSMPELLEHGVTGLLVDDLDAAVEAVPLLAGLSRSTCRQHAVERFDQELMVDQHEEVLEQIVSQARRRSGG